MYIETNGNGRRDPVEPFEESDSSGAWSIAGSGGGTQEVRGDANGNPTCTVALGYQSAGGSGVDFVYERR